MISEDSLIDDVVENLMSECAFDRNGGHGILFLLKSIDLDIRMGYSLGTVFEIFVAIEPDFWYNLSGSVCHLGGVKNLGRRADIKIGSVSSRTGR